jgi:hypothetical protein
MQSLQLADYSIECPYPIGKVRGVSLFMSEKSILAQDDIDALLGEVGNDGDSESQEGRIEQPPVTTFGTPKRVSDEEVQSLLDQLYRRAVMERERDVKIIWNASGVYPMTSGFNLRIQGRNYVSLGILNDTHLVVCPKNGAH